MIKYFYYGVFLLAIHSQHLVAQQLYTLIIPAPLNGVMGKNEYVEKLLKHIFYAQDYELKIVYSSIPSNKIRTAKLLSENRKVDLFWANARSDASQKLQVIKNPIYKGYIGFRLLLINKNNLVEFSKVTSVEQLANYTAVQKKDWLDYNILLSNGLDIEADMTFPAMFKAVEQELADYFPRSVLEIERELVEFGSTNLTVEPNLLIRYPTASYFYINKQDKDLIDIIQNGFDKIINNGVFDNHFDSYFGRTIHKHQLGKRLVLELNNPYFSQ